jgi:hypothetical protein
MTQQYEQNNLSYPTPGMMTKDKNGRPTSQSANLDGSTNAPPSSALGLFNKLFGGAVSI